MAVNEVEILQNLNLGQDADELFSNTPNDPIVLATKAFIEQAIISMQEILESDGRNTQAGSLSASLDPTEIQLSSNGISISIIAEDYAKFIDEGVDGVGFGAGTSDKLVNTVNKGKPVVTGSPYKFNPSKGVSPSFVEAMKGYNRDKPTGIDNDLAYVVASNVKRRGIRPSHFISKTFTQEAIDAFSKAIGIILTESIVVQFKKFGE
jgi:hypothetical protein